MKTILVALVLLLALAAPASACTGAAAMGMGYAYLAVADGPETVYWAPERIPLECGFSFTSSNELFDERKLGCYGPTLMIVLPRRIGLGLVEYQNRHRIYLSAQLFNYNELSLGGSVILDSSGKFFLLDLAASLLII